jgi:hypothetical protein
MNRQNLDEMLLTKNSKIDLKITSLAKPTMIELPKKVTLEMRSDQQEAKAKKVNKSHKLPSKVTEMMMTVTRP